MYIQHLTTCSYMQNLSLQQRLNSQPEGPIQRKKSSIRFIKNENLNMMRKLFLITLQFPTASTINVSFF